MGKEALDETNEDKEDPLEHLRGKARSGVSSILKAVLEEEDVQTLIRRTVVKQSLETGFFLSCLIVGGLSLVNAAKSLLSLTWQADVAVGVALIIPGIIYLAKKLKM